MLKAKKKNQVETFNDGEISVLYAKDGIITGNHSDRFRYGVKTVGVSRFYQAQSAGTKIESMIAVPYNNIIKQNDLIEQFSFSTGESTIYEIKQLQIKDTVPKSLYLTLAKGSIRYVDEREHKAVIG